jgi:5-methylcytosine-specific restriction endonuclease McrA
MSNRNSRSCYLAWKRSKSEYLAVVSNLLRETKYLCPKCLQNIDISTAHCSHIISCKILDKHKAYSLATDINNLTICCKQCNLEQGSKPELQFINDKLFEYINKYSINLDINKVA